jgi:hypothetical protein
MSESRSNELVGHVFRAMQEVDREQFGGRRSDRKGIRARGVLLRPLTATRALTLRPPWEGLR